MKLALLVIAIGTAVPAAMAMATAQQADPPAPSRNIAEILAKGDGTSVDTAYRVASIREQYEILKALGLRSDRQQFITNKDKTYDLVDARAADGTVRQVWFQLNLPGL